MGTLNQKKKKEEETKRTMSSDSTTRAQETAEAKTAFTASLHSVGTNLDADLRARATDLHQNADALNKQQDEVKRSTQELAKQNQELRKLADQGRDGLKEVGDVQNWAELIERDLLIVEETVKLAEEEDKKYGRKDVPESRLRRWF